MRNPYFILGVPADAEKSEIKSAYRRLAMAFHPDHNPTDFAAQERFAEINAAYQILSDDEKRQRFDAGLIDASGKRRPGGVTPRRSDPFAGFDINRQTVEPGSDKTAQGMAERIFGEAFHREKPRDQRQTATSQRQGERETLADTPGIDDVPTDGDPVDARERQSRGFGFIDKALKPLFDLIGGRESERQAGDTEIEITIPLADAISGGHHSVLLADGETARVATDPGIADGERIRLAGRGAEGEKGQRGDLLVTVRHERRPDLFAIGANIHVTLELTLDEAVFGASRNIETPRGEVTIPVPEWVDASRPLRFIGLGLPKGAGGAGDLMVSLRITLPQDRDEKLVDLLRLERGEWFV